MKLPTSRKMLSLGPPPQTTTMGSRDVRARPSEDQIKPSGTPTIWLSSLSTVPNYHDECTIESTFRNTCIRSKRDRRSQNSTARKAALGPIICVMRRPGLTLGRWAKCTSKSVGYRGCHGPQSQRCRRGLQPGVITGITVGRVRRVEHREAVEEGVGEAWGAPARAARGGEGGV